MAGESGGRWVKHRMLTFLQGFSDQMQELKRLAGVVWVVVGSGVCAWEPSLQELGL